MPPTVTTSNILRGGEAMLVHACPPGQVKHDIFSTAACTPNNQTRLIRAATPYLDIRRDLTFDPGLGGLFNRVIVPRLCPNAPAVTSLKIRESPKLIPVPEIKRQLPPKPPNHSGNSLHDRSQRVFGIIWVYKLFFDGTYDVENIAYFRISARCIRVEYFCLQRRRAIFG